MGGGQLTMATFAIPQADKLCMDYEARMHSLLKSTLQEEQERAAKHSEDSMVEQLSKERQLSYGLQEAAARNYRIRKSGQEEMNSMLAVVSRENHELKAEREQADVVMGVMGSQLREVEGHSAAIADGFTIQANTASARLAESDRINGRYRA